jgi:hypothetical protein
MIYQDRAYEDFYSQCKLQDDQERQRSSQPAQLDRRVLTTTTPDQSEIDNQERRIWNEDQVLGGLERKMISRETEAT